MEILDKKSTYKILKNNFFYSKKILMTLLFTSSFSYSMDFPEVDSGEEKRQRFTYRKSEVISDSENKAIIATIECKSEDLIMFAKMASLKAGRVIFDKDGPKLIIMQKKENKFQEGVEINEDRYLAVQVTSEERDGGWIHNDETLTSQKRYLLFATKILPNGYKDELLIKDNYGPSQPYKLESSTFLCSSNPIIEGGRPTRQEFQIQRSYRRGDGTNYTKIEPNSVTLALELEHHSFKHDEVAKKSYQVVNCFAKDPYKPNTCYPGPEQYCLINLPLNHKEELEAGNDDHNRNLKTHFDPNQLITPLKTNIGETLISNKRCILTGWRNDDPNLKSYKIFTIDGTNRSIFSTEEVSYTRLGRDLKPLGVPDIDQGSSRQSCNINEYYTRPDGTLYTHSLPVQDISPLIFTHLRFHHDLLAKSSYQIVKIEAMYANNRYTLHENYEVKSKPYVHFERNHSWLDDTKIHKSFKMAEIYINANNGLDGGRIAANEMLVDNNRIIETEDHKSLVILATWLPGKNWEILRNGNQY
jgi:hypothetical protein